MTEEEEVAEFYLSGYVERFHNRPTIKGQTTGQHTHGMLLLCLDLHPNPSAELLKAIIWHDSHEILGGDTPHEAKNEEPHLHEIDARFKKKFAERHGIETLGLSYVDELFLKFLDQLEVVAYLTHFANCPAAIAIQKKAKENCREMEKDLKLMGFEFT